MPEPTENTEQPPAPRDAKAEEAKPVLERVRWCDNKEPKMDTKKGVPVQREPPTPEVQIGMLTVKDLPDAATQRAGFEHPHAALLAQNIREYKLERDLGKR